MEQSNFQFVLPSIGSDGMTTNNQGALLVNQATAAIISSYLSYASSVYQNLHGAPINEGFDEKAEEMRVTPQELPALINSVQDALKQF